MNLNMESLLSNVSVVDMMNIVIFAAAGVLCLLGLLLGLKRGFFSSLGRFAVVIGMAVLAFFLASPAVAYVLGIQVTYDSTAMTLQEVIETYLMQNEGVRQILDMSPTMQQLVFHLPEAIIKELVFVLLFFLLCFLSWPVYALVARLLGKALRKPSEGKASKAKAKAKTSDDDVNVNVANTANGEGRAKAKATEGKKRGKFRLGGMLVGAAQGIFCFCIMMTMVFGLSSFATHFNAAFADSEMEEITVVTEAIDENFLSPFASNKMIKVLNSFGVDRICTDTFRELSKVEIGQDEENRSVYYFDALEGMFEPVSALLVITNMDVGNMTDDDYTALGDALDKVQSSEEAKGIVKEVVQSTVTDFVEDTCKDAATVITDRFMNNLFDVEKVSETVDVKKETEAIVNVVMVLENASASDASHTFETVSVDAIVDTVLDSVVIYDTLVEISAEPETVAIIREAVTIPDTAKDTSAEALVQYRDTAKETLSEEDYAKLAATVDAVADILGLDLSALGGDIVLPE